MEILLWLAPAALVTVLAAWGAAAAARREEEQRVVRERSGPQAQEPAPTYDDLDGGVSAPRPTRRRPEPQQAEADPETRTRTHHDRRGHQRRSA